MPTLAVSVSDEFYEKLQKLAADMERTLEECQLWALEDFYAEERANTDSLLDGLSDIAKGRVVPHEDVVAWLESLESDHPLPKPTSSEVSERLAS